MASELPNRIAVLGPGLLGGSLALAVRREIPESSLRIWARRPASIEALHALDFPEEDVSDDLAHVTWDARLIVLATPVGVMKDLLHRVLEAGTHASGVIITDVGSVKGLLVDALEKPCADAGAVYVGSHPMAGSEQAGLEYARPDLFEHARCIVTPSEATPDLALQRVCDFWEQLGSRVSVMPAGDHDRVVARISHMPHAAAAAIVRAAMDDDEAVIGFSGGGFRDTTRVASGLADMWAEILLENRSEVMQSIEDLRKNLSEMLEFLEKMDEEALASYLSCARQQRQQLGTRQKVDRDTRS